MIHEQILFGYDYDDEKNILIARNHIKGYGFFSTFTLLITSIMKVYLDFKRTPDDIDGRNLLWNLDEDRDEHHTIYTEDNIKYFKPFFDKYFNLNNNISYKVNYLKEKYNVNSENAISVIYRDTDKWTDFGGFNYISPGLYMRLVDRLKDENTDYQVMIQTENYDIKNFFGSKYRAVFFDETSLTGSTGNPMLFSYQKRNKLKWTEYYMASLWIHSQSKYLITYTGNSSFFLYLNRGTTKNMFQEITFTKKNLDDFFVNNN
jgi:hypothetical protein